MLPNGGNITTSWESSASISRGSIVGSWLPTTEYDIFLPTVFCVVTSSVMLLYILSSLLLSWVIICVNINCTPLTLCVLFTVFNAFIGSSLNALAILSFTFDWSAITGIKPFEAAVVVIMWPSVYLLTLSVNLVFNNPLFNKSALEIVFQSWFWALLNCKLFLVAVLSSFEL